MLNSAIHLHLDHNSTKGQPGDELQAAFKFRVSCRPLNPIISAIW